MAFWTFPLGTRLYFITEISSCHLLTLVLSICAIKKMLMKCGLDWGRLSEEVHELIKKWERRLLEEKSGERHV